MGNPLQLRRFAAYLRLDRGLGPRTVEAYTADVAQALGGGSDPGTGTDVLPLSAVTRVYIEDRLARVQEAGAGPRSLARKISALRAYFRFAVAEELCPSDPMEGIESPSIPRGLPKTLAVEHVEALLAEPLRREPNSFGAEAPRADAVMLRVLYASGLRVSELIGLRCQDADLQAGVLRVQGKGGKVRVVPVDTETVSLLTHYLKHVRPRLSGPRNSTALFLSSRGTPFTRQGFWKLVRKYAMAAGIPAVSPHVLRHAFATHLMERGMNLRSLQMLLGHSDISTTEIYSHVSAPHLHEALRKHHPRGK